jgi:acetoin utilization deacetylase AcuC-like enzyme
MEPLAYFYPQGHAVHFEAGHPERPERVDVIRTALQQRGLWDEFPQLAALELDEQVLASIHTSAYLNLLEISCRRGGHLDADTYLTPSSWRLALAAAGGAAAIARAVWSRQAKRGFALTRPPGHHATRGQGMGFCLLNNIALAAETLLQQDKASRLAVVDIDLHHGNGTQDIFYQRGDVLYISTHQSPLYPGTGWLEEMGAGAGVGKNANFPFPPGTGDIAFITVMDELIVPLLERYEPEMILVSYGFDAHWSDPLGHLLLSAAGYQSLIQRLTEFADLHCQGRIAVFLEGGYNLEAAAICSWGVVAALLGENIQDTLGSSPYPETKLWENMLERAHRLWQL